MVRFSQFSSIGQVSFLNAKINSILDLTGASFEASTDEDIAVVIHACKIESLVSGEIKKGNFRVTTKFSGVLSIVNSQFNGDLFVSSIEASHRQLSGIMGATEPEKLYARNLVDIVACEILGRVFLSGTFRGGIDLRDTYVKRSIQVGAEAGKLHFICPPRNLNVLCFENFKCDSTLYVDSLAVETPTGVDRLLKTLKNKKEVINTRSFDLSFAPECQLHEIQIVGIRRTFYTSIVTQGEKMSLLDGKGPSIIAAFSKTNTTFDTDDSIRDYLRLFTNNVNASYGPFKIVEPRGWLCNKLPSVCHSSVEPLEIVPPEEMQVSNPADYIAGAHATIWYGNTLYRSKLMLRNSLLVEMLEDVPVYEGLPVQVAFIKPLKCLEYNAELYSDDWEIPPSVATEASQNELSISGRKKLLKLARKLPMDLKIRPEVNMQNARIEEISDRNGNAWPEQVRLKLTGLIYNALRVEDRGNEHRVELSKAWAKTYESRKIPKLFAKLLALCFAVLVIREFGLFLLNIKNINGIWWIAIASIGILLLIYRSYSSPNMTARTKVAVWKSRKRWLRLQYEEYAPSKLEYNPQPLEQLALTFRRQGQEDDFKQISRLKLYWKEKSKMALVWRPFSALFRIGFGYGFSTFRSSLTILFLLAIGTFATGLAIQHEILVVNTQYDGHMHDSPEIPCRDQVIPTLYALDTFIPIIELGQENICHIRSNRVEPTAFPKTPMSNRIQSLANQVRMKGVQTMQNNTIWRFAKSMYKMLGWISISLFILTITNSIRRSTS